MFNAKRSALYIAIIGLGFAAGEASAACPTGYRSVTTYTAGYKVTVCQKVGSDVVGVDVQNDGGEGGPPLFNPVVQAGVTGATITIDGGESFGFVPSIGFAPDSFMKASFTKAKKPKPPKGPKCYIYVPKDGDDDGDDAHDKVKKVKVPCTAPVTLYPDDPLTYADGTEVVTLYSSTERMTCTGNDENQTCSKEVVVGPTDEDGLSYKCPVPPGGFTTALTPIPPFVTTVDINHGAIVAYVGCYDFDVGGGPGIPGSSYLCEALDDFGFYTPGCGTGNVSGDTYCTTNAPPVVEASCTGTGVT